MTLDVNHVFQWDGLADSVVEIVHQNQALNKCTDELTPVGGISVLFE